MPVSRVMDCPIGGERFRFTTTASYSIFGYRPDGKPFGSWEFPLALPVCPGNGLVVYKRFSDEELDRLRPLIASPDYHALLGETSYYRAYWLQRRMGAEPHAYIWTLVQAGWQADPGLRQRYLAELAEQAGAHFAEVRDIRDLAMRARHINALRELGRFEDAARLWDATPLDRFETAQDDRAQEENRVGWLAFYQSLRMVIDRGDASAEPLDMMPRRFALGRCIDDAAELDGHQRAFCEAEAEDVDRMRRQRLELEERLRG